MIDTSTDDTEEASEDSRCPTQEDINEGICIDTGKVQVSRGFLGRVETDGWIAYYRRRRIVEEESRKTFFKMLNEFGLKECFPRIFHVNDHGNVSEFSYTGRVIGEWV